MPLMIWWYCIQKDFETVFKVISIVQRPVHKSLTRKKITKLTITSEISKKNNISEIELYISEFHEKIMKWLINLISWIVFPQLVSKFVKFKFRYTFHHHHKFLFTKIIRDSYRNNLISQWFFFVSFYTFFPIRLYT